MGHPSSSSLDSSWKFGWEDWLSRDDAAQMNVDKTRSITDKVEALRGLVADVKIFMADDKVSCLSLPPSLVGQSWVQS